MRQRLHLALGVAAAVNVGSLLLIGSTLEAVLIQHVGSTNPAVEDARPDTGGTQTWTEINDPPASTVGPSGDATPSWSISSAAALPEYKYNISPTGADVADANANGFKLTTNL